MAKRSIFSKRNILVALNVLVIVGLAGFGGYYFNEHKKLKNSTPEKLQEQQSQSIIDAVNKLYQLPKDEKPTIATVSTEQAKRDALKKEYPFFDQAEGNDVVLIYPKAKVAILYRPSTNQIVKVAPVNVQDGVSIKLLGKEADRGAVEKLLNDNKLQFSKGDPKTSITGVIVVDVKGTNGEQAKKLAEIVKGQVASLPEGEDKPADVDLLVFVGPASTPAETPQP